MLLIESIFIGIYCLIILKIFIILDIKNIIFYFGFIKHFSGYIFGLHSFYCKYKQNKNLNNKNIIIESLLENIWFYTFYILIYKLFNNEYYTFFIIGFITHIIAEITGIHKEFLKNNCN